MGKQLENSELLKEIDHLKAENKDLRAENRELNEELEKSLNVSENEFKDLYENAPVAFQALDKHGYILNVNPRWCWETGYKKQEILGKHFSTFLTSESKKQFIENFPLLIEYGRMDDIVLSIVRKDRKVISVSYSASVTRDAKGKFLHTNCIFQEITEKLRAREAHKRSEEKFRKFLDNSTDAIRVVDETGKIIFINKAFTNLTGYSYKEVKGRYFWDVLYNLIPENKKYEGLYNNFKHTGLNFLNADEQARINTPYEIEIETKQRKSLIVQDVIFRMNTEYDLQLGGIMRDITELKEKEKQLRELVAARDKIFSIIAHDLRSPFNTILGFTELALEQCKSFGYSEMHDNLNQVYQSAQKSSNLLENLLQWSRMQTGKIKFEPENLNLAAVVENITTLLQESIVEKRIDLKVNVPPNMKVFADTNMLETILRNLLSNAIKYVSKQGAIYVDALQQNQQTKISIKDTGIGISPEKLDNLFNLGDDKSTQSTDKKEGGLGLLLCKDFVRQHGGEIWAESAAGKGAKFIFTLPVKQD
ncbi:MAG: PAS domain-containing sensor histidine kinase [Bacteroidales bacterium]|nr:PAS domain-containing sensor histidine kinase [Bacteroidales bacterium]MCF8337693.1 PAS domain-containing sensor histidine kinase [Bacteroidales bacterium]